MQRLLAAFIVLTLTAVASAANAPPVFSDLSVADAKQQAIDDGRLLVVDATASWCVPCRQMDRNTWVNDRVAAWLGTHAIAVQFDVDKQEAVARELKIQAMPTVIVFREGIEFDRVVGYQSPGDLLTWLEGVRDGRRSVDLRREQAKKRAEADDVDVMAQLRMARSLQQRGDFDAATKEFLWLWDHMLEHDRSAYGVRVSFMVGDMKRLAEAHPPAREAFRALRDREQARIDAGETARAVVTDWYHLNQIIGDAEPVLAWFDRLKGRPEAARQFAALDAELFELLGARDRWADTVHIYEHPAEQAKELVDRHKLLLAEDGVDARHRQLIESGGWRFVVEKTSRMYAACLAGKRDEEAVKVAETVMEYRADASTLELFIGNALRAGQAREHQLEWIAEADRFDIPTGDLRQRVEAMLKE